MSEETLEYLNAGNILIGNADKRGNAWWYDKNLEDPDNPTHYSEFIPVTDVQQRLFNWEAQVINLHMDIPGDNPKIVNRVKVEDYIAVVRSDTRRLLGIHGADYQPHQLTDTFIAETANIVGGTDQLGITSGGLLKNGAVAWMEISIPETLHCEHAGFSYRPNLLTSTSFNGTLPTSWTRTKISTVCDNTLQWSLKDAGNTGKYKVRHTKFSQARIKDAKTALGILEQSVEEMDELLKSLVETKVSELQFNKWLDLMVPIPAVEEGKNNRGITVSINKRDKLIDLWTSDKRAAPWRNTALGVMQVINTYSHHENSVAASKFDGNKLQARVERNQFNVLRGTQEKIDNEAFRLLSTVLANA